MTEDSSVPHHLQRSECCVPPNAYVEALTPSVMTFEDGAFGR